MVTAKTIARITIPVQRHGSFETIWSVLPWFLCEFDQTPSPSSPQILTFTQDQFMPAFFEAIEQLDSALTMEGFEKLVPFRDYSEPPVGMLDVNNLPLYPGSIQRQIPLLLEAAENTADWPLDGDGIPQDNPAWLRKLYLPLHQHFHLITAELVCKRVNFPRVNKDRIIESGLIIRRLVADKDRERWQDWIAGPEGHGVWLEIADKMMIPLHDQTGQTLDSRALNPNLFGDAIQQGRLALRLELEPADSLPSTLDAHPMNLIPSSVGRANDHTAFFGYLPLQSNDQILPQFPNDPAMLQVVAEWLAQRARRVLGDIFFSESQFDGTLPNPLPAHIVEHLQKLEATLWEGASHSDPDFGGLLALFQNTILPPKPANQTIDGLVAAIWGFPAGTVIGGWRKIRILSAAYMGFNLMADLLWQQIIIDHETEIQNIAVSPVNTNLAINYWNGSVGNNITGAVINQIQLQASWGPFQRQWTQNAIGNHPEEFKDLFVLIVYEVIDAFRRIEAGQNSWDSLNLVTPPLIATIPRLIITALIRIRAYRKHLLTHIYKELGSRFSAPNISELNKRLNGIPRFTVGSYSDEITAWIEAERERVLGLKQWGWPSLKLFEADGTPSADMGGYIAIHLQHIKLESYLAEFEKVMALTDGAITDVVADIADERSGQLTPTYATLLELGFNINEQAARGLLVVPSFPVRPDALVDVIDKVVELYSRITDAQSVDFERARAIVENAQRVRRPRYDADSLYAVWVYHRVAGHTPCEQEQIIWNGPSDIFSIAEPADVLGAKPVAFQLPDLPKLIKNIPRIARAKAHPFAAVTIPKNSNVIAKGLEDISRSWGMSLSCSFGIPVFTICAWVAFQIIFNILLFFGFGWFLFLKFCFPGSSRN